MPVASKSHPAQVIAVHGRHCVVDVDGEPVTCVARGKKSHVACGDRVHIAMTAKGQGVIEAVEPRRTLLYRSDEHREKLIAANVDQMIVVLAAVPSFYQELLDRCLVAAEFQGVHPLVVLNKSDLVEESRAARERLRVYAQLGYEILPLVARTDVSPLEPYLAGRSSVLVGQSGMGKSTIVNALVPDAGAAVGEISLALDSGRHTTTYARMYRLGAQSRLIDSPGMQEFGLGHVPAKEIARCFPEMRPWLGQCRFNDCAHLVEPDCAVRIAADKGEIDRARLRSYTHLMEEARRVPRY